MKIVCLILSLLGMFFISSCGLKGDLYIDDGSNKNAETFLISQE